MKNIIFIFLLSSFLSASAQLKINEIMSNNVSAVMDNSYNYSMWVELYNSGSTAANQMQFYLTDNLAEPRKWRPSSYSIPAGGFNVLWFEREDISGHANFKLEPEGGVLYLMNASGGLVDKVEYPKQYRNVSYGRLTDGADDWVYFYEYSNGRSNKNKKWSGQKCEKPKFSLEGGFYTTAPKLKFENLGEKDTVYYTSNGSEPTRSSTRYTAGSQIQISKTSVIRAITFSGNKQPSDIVSNTYFVNQRNFNLPVVSIITEKKNLTDYTIGIYVDGTNGIPGNCVEYPVNWNQDWSRPANFELFDKNGKPCLNQELDITLAGGCSRGNPQKSLKISPRKKFGENHLRYDIFSATKPEMKYKDILFRNSGNDFWYSMLRDGFMQSLIINRMDIDYQAYEPAVCFMNGEYYGIQNLRERTNTDYLYSNYGLDEEDFYLLDAWDIQYNSEFLKLTNYLKNNDITQPAIYAKAAEMLDVDSYISYMLSQIYYGNTDWPGNNFKVWKKKNNGKWRWILYDTDFGYNLYDWNLHNHNSLTYVLNEVDEWSVYTFRRLLRNDEFKNKFIQRFCVQLSSTFETERVNHILDSLASRISTEIVYHKNKYGGNNFNNDINNMKNFSKNRPDKMLGFIGQHFFKSKPVKQIRISSNNEKASYKFLSEDIIDNKIVLKYFAGETINIEANKIRGYDFKYWEISGSASSVSIVPMGSDWKYWDNSGIPANNWYASEYADNDWKSGLAQLGYGNKGEVTTIGYGGDANNKYITAYFRKKVDIENMEDKKDFSITVFVDDGAAVYVNGTEVGRFNLPTGALNFNTTTLNYNNGEYATFVVDKKLLKASGNIIAVEVHQTHGQSGDLIFDLSFDCVEEKEEETQTQTDAVFTTTLSSDIELKAIYEDNGEPKELPEPTQYIYINEIVSNNEIIDDEFGEKDDYIELYNAGDEAIDIAGWYITDTPVNKRMHQFATNTSNKTTIPAKGRIILWADKQPEQGALHLDFALSKDGETIVLSYENEDKELIIVDKVAFPDLKKNTSYSRNPDGSDNWVVQAPTFNAPNDKLSSLPENTVGTVQIYPTLIHNYFVIEQAAGETIRIIDVTGKIYMQYTCTTEREIVQTEHLSQGVYFVVLQNKTFKVVKM